MFVKNFLISIALLKIVIAIDEPLKVGLDSLKNQYKILTDCQTKVCGNSYKIDIAENVSLISYFLNNFI